MSSATAACCRSPASISAAAKARSSPRAGATGRTVPSPSGSGSSSRHKRKACVERSPSATIGGDPAARDRAPMNDEILRKLEERLGRLHAQQRLGIEREHEAQVFGYGLNFFHFESWRQAPALIRNALRLAGLYGRARRNAD